MWDCDKEEIDSGSAPLLVAARDGELKHMKEQLTAGADVKQTDEKGFTALILAAKNGHDECVDLLIKSGADVNAWDLFGTTALMRATDDNHVQCLMLLIEAGPDVNVATLSSLKGRTALNRAIKWGHIKCVDLLLNAGADVNNFKEDTNSALILALHSCYGPVANNLWQLQDNFVSRSVEMSLPESHFKRPLEEEADVNKALKCLKLLLQSGAHVNITNKYHHNALQCYIAECEPVVEELAMVLLAAGEIIEGTTVEMIERFGRLRSVEIPEFLQMNKDELNLKDMCRETIRKHLLHLDRHANLFQRIPNLQLPSLVTDYLLFDVTL